MITTNGYVVPLLGGEPGAWQVGTPCQHGAVITDGIRITTATVLIDPGHGGDETGAVGPTGLPESEVNLDIAFRLQAWLREQGVEAALTRTDDYYVAIAARAEMAHAIQPELMISIHHNDVPGIAKTDNPGVSVFYQSNSPEAERLGGIVQEELLGMMADYTDVQWVGGNIGGARWRLSPEGEDFYGVLRRTAPIVTVLSEAMYLSNPEEESLLEKSVSDSYRLPGNVLPRHYQVELEPNIANHSFAGTVAIQVDVTEATASVVLNAIELDLLSATVTQDGQEQTAEVALDEETERATLTLQTPLAVGPAEVNIAFNGILNDKLRGFYRSTYTDADGQEQTLATTQFESTNARRAFPCWDEPERKATFGVTLVVDADLMAISSGPERSSTELGDGRRRVEFENTVLMSTYLLGPSWTLVAVPDFAFGAMENFGCATFREILLIVDTETATPSEMERSVDVIAHEIAHMWFGDLVTMTWWEGIWLKEAFATFCELLATDAFAPEWDRWTSFGLSRTAAFDTDSLLSTRPIEFEVVSPADAEAMYDVLTYEKGAAVVRMLQMFLGPDEFKQGINHYLTKHAYGNTQTHDLWDALEESTGQPARKIMDSWIFQGGYPLVTVDKTGPTTVRFSQERFGYSADTPSAIWGVPLVLTVSAGGTQRQERVLLDTESIEVDLGGEPIDWIQGNAESSGFYRVRYAGELQQAILDAHRSLTALERYSVVDDSWASFMADRLDHSQYRSIIEAFADEDDLSVWQRITGTMLSVDHHLTGDQQAEFQTWAQGLLVPALERIGTTPGDDDSDRLRQTRAALFSTLGQLNHAPTVTAARSVHADTSDPTLKAASATVMAATGTAQEWDEFAELYRNAPTPQEERRYLYSLAGFPGADEMSRVLALIDSEQVRSQDAPFVLATAMRNGQHGQKAWDYMVTNWDTLNERYPRQRHPSYGVGLHLVGRARAGNRNPLVLRPASTPPGRQNPGPVTGAFGCSGWRTAALAYAGVRPSPRQLLITLGSSGRSAQ
ncbi:Aminopeptidase M1-C [Nymphon striatum]|nr:Aminopeptidase M1-C [Nymphon striatum]